MCNTQMPSAASLPLHHSFIRPLSLRLHQYLDLCEFRMFVPSIRSRSFKCCASLPGGFVSSRKGLCQARSDLIPSVIWAERRCQTNRCIRLRLSAKCDCRAELASSTCVHRNGVRIMLRYLCQLHCLRKEYEQSWLNNIHQPHYLAFSIAAQTYQLVWMCWHVKSSYHIRLHLTECASLQVRMVCMCVICVAGKTCQTSTTQALIHDSESFNRGNGNVGVLASRWLAVTCLLSWFPGYGHTEPE